MSKIQVGYGSDRREGSTKRGLYGNKSNGKRNENGGFNGCPTVTFTKIDEDKWNAAFPNSFKPFWAKDKKEEM